MKKLVCGVGIYEKGRFKATEYVCGKRKITKVYGMWRSMLERCYSVKNKNRDVTYSECSVSENFKYFQRFAEWAEKQVGFGEDGFEWYCDGCEYTVPQVIDPRYLCVCVEQTNFTPISWDEVKKRFEEQQDVS